MLGSCLKMFLSPSLPIAPGSIQYVSPRWGVKLAWFYITLGPGSQTLVAPPGFYLGTTAGTVELSHMPR